MKTIDIIRTGTPETLPVYHDSVQVTSAGDILFEGHFSAEPNATRPPPNEHVKWMDFGARVAEGVYSGVVTDGTNSKYPGKYIYIYNSDGGIEIPTINPNLKHSGEYFAKGVLIHTGWSNSWTGSIACFTIPPAGAEMFWGLFDIGEKVKINLRKAAP